MSWRNKCPKHPQYKAVKKPQCECCKCWEIWKRLHCDTNGVEIEVGQTVAYNKEGTVVPGKVIEVGTKTKYGEKEPVFVIELESDYFEGWHKRGHISKVNNPASILVLHGPVIEEDCGERGYL